ncbi:STAS domain-containing protein [Nocardioides yefusunii]|uniref:STAS domain-containing protein n=1 Tax=Nocardioides yefusunii TaxID=2500546 RepID=A0ABW1QYS0_9ACTN|nr:STAS domain-containing protein [Nocardioides yefusunii]
MQMVLEDSTLRLGGAFDVRSTSVVREVLHLLIEEGGVIVVDLSEVEAVDLTALRLLAVATRRATRAGGRLVMRGCGPSVCRMMHISRMARQLEFERELRAA